MLNKLNIKSIWTVFIENFSNFDQNDCCTNRETNLPGKNVVKCPTSKHLIEQNYDLKRIAQQMAIKIWFHDLHKFLSNKKQNKSSALPSDLSFSSFFSPLSLSRLCLPCPDELERPLGALFAPQRAQVKSCSRSGETPSPR